MERVDRLERLTDLVLVLLRGPRPKSLREIAEEVPGYPPPGEARRQAFERDKRTLRQEGIAVVAEPIDGPEQVGYRIRPEEFYLPDLDLAPDEQAALNLAVAAVHFEDPSGQDALWRLGVGGPHAPRPLAALPSLPALPLLFDALRARAVVRFTYRGARRAVAPAQLRFRHGWWYLVGTDLDRRALRIFRVDRMDGPVEREAPGSAEGRGGEPVTSGSVRAGGPWPAAAADTEAVVAEVLVDAVVADVARNQVGDGALAERRPDGSVVLRLEVATVEALRAWVFEFGPHAEVLGPPDVRQEVVRWLAQVAASAP